MFDADQTRAILAALHGRVVQPCPSCGQKARSLIPEVVFFTAGATFTPPPPSTTFTYPSNKNSPTPAFAATFPPTGPPTLYPTATVIPCICLVCSNCGNMDFLNIHVLGLA